MERVAAPEVRPTLHAPRPTLYACAVPHSEQNFAARGSDVPQLVQNFDAGEPVALGVPPGADVLGLSASAIVFPIAKPAPKPAPRPAPPPGFAAAVGIDCAT